MTLSHPAEIGFTVQSWAGVNRISRQVSEFTLNAQSYQWPADRLSVACSLPILRTIHGQQWQAFFNQLKGGDFWLGPSKFLWPRTHTGSPYVIESTDGPLVKTAGWIPRQDSVLKDGQFIEIAGRLRIVYGVVDTDSEGQATIVCSPHLHGVKAGTPVNLINPRGRFMLPDGPPVLTWRVDRFMDAFTFNALEVDHEK